MGGGAGEGDVLVVLTTVGDGESAAGLARALVEERLAACVSVAPGVRSVYRWEGRVVEDSEYLLIVKTTESGYEMLESRLREMHPYDVPEVIGLRAARVLEAYLSWLRGAVKP